LLRQSQCAVGEERGDDNSHHGGRRIVVSHDFVRARVARVIEMRHKMTSLNAIDIFKNIFKKWTPFLLAFYYRIVMF
jgi:hypothetical protein